uniref:RING-type domain-containing protein n=1 Tax=Panthera leo TaxID=9689 RepID=A0A8C8XNR3_PANLE
MAGLDPGLAIPVWLAEDDLGCIICQGLLAWPATLPCGHSFCRDCLKGLWAAGSPGRRRSCPTCREGAAQPPQLRKNTLLQELADKYSRALRELKEAPRRSRPAAAGAAPEPARPPPRRAAQLPWNSKKVHLPLHARCLTTVTLPPRGPPGLLSGPSVRPLTFGATAVVWRCPRTAGW